MALENVVVITEFIDKATVWFLAFIYNPTTGELDDPTAVKITIIDPDGNYAKVGETDINGVAMTQYESETGIYEYYYHKGTTAVAMAQGEWRGRVDAIDGELTSAVFSPQSFSFRVK